MSQEVKFFICKHCGNLVEMVHNGGGKLVCCGEAMTELAANTTEAATEKHIPVITVVENTVTVEVGSVAHPMTAEHYIVWICIQTESGIELKYLEPGQAPKATFALTDDKVVAAFAYCNLHGLWKAEV